MAKWNDGGPAYPVSEIRGFSAEGVKSGNAGMSLRDWFAGQPMESQGGIPARDAATIMGMAVPAHNAPPDEWFTFWMAWEAYRKYAYADAMLKQREA